MSDLKDIKNLINSGKEVYTITEIRNLYDEVKFIVAQQSDIKHIYYRNKKERNITIWKDFLSYKKM